MVTTSERAAKIAATITMGGSGLSCLTIPFSAPVLSNITTARASTHRDITEASDD